MLKWHEHQKKSLQEDLVPNMGKKLERNFLLLRKNKEKNKNAPIVANLLLKDYLKVYGNVMLVTKNLQEALIF